MSTGTPIQDELQPRVEAGAEWLDQVLPGWHLKIDLSRLSMYSECQCVLGQLAIDIAPEGYTAMKNFDEPTLGFWSWVCGRLGGVTKLTNQEAVDRGFNLGSDDEAHFDDTTNWDVLHDLWTLLISARQGLQL